MYWIKLFSAGSDKKEQRSTAPCMEETLALADRRARTLSILQLVCLTEITTVLLTTPAKSLFALPFAAVGLSALIFEALVVHRIRRGAEVELLAAYKCSRSNARDDEIELTLQDTDEHLSGGANFPKELASRELGLMRRDCCELEP
jgi:hypothetical protein